VNVDLDVRGKSLGALAQAFSGVGCLLNDQRCDKMQEITFELSQSFETIQETVARMIEVADALSGAARAEWLEAQSRVFNVGLHGGTGVRYPVITIAPSLIANIAEQNCGLTFTHYPHHDQTDTFAHDHIA